MYLLAQLFVNNCIVLGAFVTVSNYLRGVFILYISVYVEYYISIGNSSVQLKMKTVLPVMLPPCCWPQFCPVWPFVEQ